MFKRRSQADLTERSSNTTLFRKIHHGQSTNAASFNGTGSDYPKQPQHSDLQERTM